jgi:hypothetical protein
MSELTVEQYLMDLPLDLQAITRELREVARKNMPGAYEFIYHDAIGYSVSKSPFDRICYISWQRAYLNFGFFFGVGLSDPSHLLVGEGKRLRHVKIRSMEDAKCRPWVSLSQLHGKKRLNQSQKSVLGVRKINLENEIHRPSQPAVHFQKEMGRLARQTA